MTLKTRRMEKTSSPFLHNDVLQEIFLRLPMKRLAQCRLVSKYWNNIIGRPRFTVEGGRSYSPNRTMHVYLDGLSLIIQGRDSILRAKSWFLDIDRNAIVVGTWDGLICLSSPTTENCTLVWNPFLKKSIQKCYFEHTREGSYFFGFGFDDVKNGYKVIKIIQSRKETSVEIHNLYTKVASVILLSSNQVSFQLTNAIPVTVHGYSHWIGVNLLNRRLEIVWFDLVKEKFVNVPFASNMPNIIFHLGTDNIIIGRQPTAELEIDGLKFRLGIFKGSVCLFISHSNVVEIWCMKNHASSYVWSKEFEIKLHYPREEVVGFNANDELVIAYIGKTDYVACNPWTQKLVYPIGNNCCLSINQVVPYVESLVPVKPPEPTWYRLMKNFISSLV